MQSLAVIIVIATFATQSLAMSTMLSVNSTQLRGHPLQTSYGKDACRCIGVDNMKGYYATQLHYHHVQYPLEAGASCGAWESGRHPKCAETPPPKWCTQQWCYVDPCSCGLEAEVTEANIEYQGKPAYWSYATCGFTDLWSQEKPKAAQAQELVKTCKEISTNDASVHGQDDCRCVGLGGKNVGKAFMHINDTDVAAYPPNVGATCEAWEDDVHPECKTTGEKPSWCSQKWCIVDPCKCKTKTPPRTVMSANEYMRFQGKTAYWSYDTCGSKDTWSSSHEGEYCVTQESEAACSKMSKCSWNGKECLGKALVELCEKQEESGVLGTETPLKEEESGALSPKPLMALFAAFIVFA